MFEQITLREWQKTYKPVDKLIVQASISDGSSRNEKFDFSIGMNHLYLTLNEEQKKSTQVGNHENLVFCAMKTHTDRRRRGNMKKNRATILNTIIKNNIKNIELKPLEYFESLKNYKFTISPEGNGIDCHRHYEAIISGCIPIVEENEYMRKKYEGVPVLYTEDYSEITPEYLEKKYEEMLDKEYDYSKMFITYFDDKNKALIKQYSHHWCLKYQKKKFYN